MPIISIIEGDILLSEETCIVQQCNCNTIQSHGFSKAIANKYPWADVYKQRAAQSKNTAKNAGVPGTLQVVTKDNMTVICMFAQWAPGKPFAFSKYYPKGPAPDSIEERKNWFTQCLVELDNLQLERVAMPHGIGCGLAGGIWSEYKELLNNAHTNIVLYKLS